MQVILGNKEVDKKRIIVINGGPRRRRGTRIRYFFSKNFTLGIPWRDSIYRPISPFSSMAGGDMTTT
jgi:hypothetical protein